MKAEDLKNYGKPLSDIMLDREVVRRGKRMTWTIMGTFCRELGLVGTIKLVLRIRKEAKRMKRHDWSSLREKGLVDQRFLEHLIQQAAAMKALADIVGIERASDIYRKLIDNIGYDLTAPMFPLIKDFKACGDAFEAFKDYARAMMVADQRAGLHEVEVIEDSPSIFAYDVKYCIWNEVAKEFGVSQLCYAGRCYGDEVFFNTVLPKVGAVYKRAGTLTLGAPVCDVRFELRTQENK